MECKGSDDLLVLHHFRHTEDDLSLRQVILLYKITDLLHNLFSKISEETKLLIEKIAKMCLFVCHFLRTLKKITYYIL